MSANRHLLMIAYYFPPLGMGGVQRPLKFAKFLPECGWDVTVVTSERMRYHALDETLLQELQPSVRIERVKSADLAELYGKVKRGSRGDQPQGSPGSIARRIQTWLRWPDDKRGFAHAVAEYAMTASLERPFDVIYSTSPPPSVHLAGLKLQGALRIPWVADFRDPWLVGSDDWGPTPLHRQYAKSTRSRILRRADHTLVMNDRVADEFRMTAQACNMTVIPNGYDEDDFVGIETAGHPSNMTLAYYGTISPQTNIDALLRLVDVANERHPTDPVNVLHIGTTVGIGTILHPRFTSTGYLPHRAAIETMCSASVVVLSLNDDPSLHMTIQGRTYEALRSLRPILAFAPAKSVFAQTLQSFPNTWVFDPSDINGAVDALSLMRQQDQNKPSRTVKSLAAFDRRVQTYQLAEILNGLVGSRSEARERR